MIKLLDYTQNYNKVTLNFEKNQWVDFHKFGEGIFTDTSEGITKSAVKEIKQKLLKEGLDYKLDEFINKQYFEYWEEGSYGE